MATGIWQLSFKVLKVNKKPYDKRDEMVRAAKEEIPRLIKEGAEKLAERFDFAFVEVVAKSTETGEKFTYTFQSDDGYRDDWQTSRK